MKELAMARDIENCKLQIENCRLLGKHDNPTDRGVCRRSQFSIFNFQFSIFKVLLLALAGLVWLASRPQATGPAEGTKLDCPAAWTAPASRGSFRVGAFNIHGCTGADGRRDVDRVADCVKDLDFAALNEVHGPQPWESADQAALLGRRLGVPWLFAPATRNWHTIEFGNGLLTSLPVEAWQRIPLAANNHRGERNAVLARVRQGGQTISVLLTHIARSDDVTRQRELHQTIDLFLAQPEPAIFLGDLNSEVGEPEVRRLLAAPGVIDAVGQKLGPNAPPRIDFVFVRGLRVLDAGLRDLGASDHPLAWAEVTTE
jgi:endonuclease/exonuclease/phosphatase family metal-dependent hydrolase